MSKPLQGWIPHPFNVPRHMRHWLTDRGSLTRRLKAHCPDFRVRPLATGLARPNADEHKLLLLRPGSLAYVREVLLSCHGKPVVFAHSVLPRSGLRGGWNGITRLGARPLGEALFNDHRIKRESLAYLRLSPHHALFHAASPHHACSAPARGTPAGTPLLAATLPQHPQGVRRQTLALRAVLAQRSPSGRAARCSA